MRVEDTAASLQSAIIAPAREGFALLSGVRAALAALRDTRSANAPARSARHDDEEALFIG
jgi:hypothetical protein